MVANSHSVDGGSRWSAVACVSKGNGIPVALALSLCFFFYIFFMAKNEILVMEL